jgi:Raf kinase inhibitor-like YbhB/YbcL family protein
VRRTLGVAIVSVAVLLGGCAATGQTELPSGVATTEPEPSISTPADSPSASSSAPVASAPETEVTAVSPTPFRLESTAFDDGGPIPTRHTCDGDNSSPDLTWSGAPEATLALALVVTDPDARGFVHWLAYDLTGTPSGGLPAAVSASPDAPPQGTNSFGATGYGGPCPPSGVHHYEFVLYALDNPLGLQGAPDIDALRTAMDGHVLAETTLTGTYQR